MIFQVVCAWWPPNFTVRLRATYIESIYTGCPRRKGQNFGRVFLMLKYTDITQKHLYTKLNDYGDNGQRSLKL